MSGAARSVLLVAGPLGVHDDGRSIVPFLDRLAGLGLDPHVLCLEAAGDVAADRRVVECPGLAHRWRRPFTLRGLRFGDSLDRPDLLHALGIDLAELALAIAEHWSVPYVLTVDEFLPPSGGLRVSRRWCRRLIAASRELADELRNQLRVPSPLVAEVNPGLELPDEAAPRSADRRVAVIGTAGPLVAGSGFATFLNAARRVLDAGVDAEFVIAGQGEDEVDLRRRADRLKIADRVTFAGIPVVGLRFWSVLDVYCQTSLVPSVGHTLATALAFGVPSVASDIQGLRAMLTHGETGLCVPPGDSPALARAITDLLADRKAAHALGQAGRAQIGRDFRPEDEALQLANVYDEAVEAPAACLVRRVRPGP